LYSLLLIYDGIVTCFFKFIIFYQLLQHLSKNEAIVLDMMERYLYRGHIVNCDRLYTSPRLFLELVQRGTHATGTVQKRRQGMPKEKYIKYDFLGGLSM
jgi:hypothetical protein